jgi:hypothetical protein
VAAFVALCALPTAVVLLWGVSRYWPGRVAAEARRLSGELGLDVSLEGMRHLRPGTVLYEGLEIADPETGKPLLRCRVVEAQWTDVADTEGRSKPSLLLIASQAEVQAGGLPRLWRLVRQPLQREGGPAQLDVRLRASDLTLQTDKRAETLSDVQGSIELLSGGAQAQVDFRLAAAAASKPARIRIVRNRQLSPPASGFELDTGGGALPCGLLAMGVPELEPLGPDARFRGHVWFNEAAGGPTGAWEGEVTGQLTQVDLGRLVSDRFPHKLSGTAEVSIHKARFHRSRLEEAHCSLSAGPGVISRSLVEAAAAKLALAKGEMATTDLLLPYHQLSFAAEIDAGGLKIQGICSGDEPATILCDARGPLLSDSPTQPSQPVVALLQTLVPASEVQVPATRQTDWLMQHLPLPRVVPPPGSESAAPYSRLRLGGAVEKK